MSDADVALAEALRGLGVECVRNNNGDPFLRATTPLCPVPELTYTLVARLLNEPPAG